MENFKVQVPGTDFFLESNKTYRLSPKYDSSAPDGFKKRGITKFEHPMNGEPALCPFNSQRNIWDTGLYEGSPCYARHKDIGKKNTKVFVEQLIPLLEETFPEGALSQKSDNKYWDSYMFHLNQKITVGTSTPENFLGMWLALISYTVAPEADQKNPIYRQMKTPFILVDRKEKGTNEQRLEFEKSKATSRFISSIIEDEESKEFVVDVLNYVGFPANKETDNGILNSQFKRWLDNKDSSTKNATYFNEAFEKLKTESGREELEIYKTLKNSKSLRKERGEYYFEDTSLGANLKIAAAKINEEDTLKTKYLGSIDDN